MKGLLKSGYFSRGAEISSFFNCPNASWHSGVQMYGMSFLVNAFSGAATLETPDTKCL
jgi:hypothetical protein